MPLGGGAPLLRCFWACCAVIRTVHSPNPAPRRWGVARLGLAAILAACCAGPPPAAALSIMPLGDSIGVGQGSSIIPGSGYDESGKGFVIGWRAPLGTMLREAGVDFDFVGTIHDGPNWFQAWPFDPDHQAVPGIEADRVQLTPDGQYASQRGSSLLWALQYDKDGKREPGFKQPDPDGLSVFDIVKPDVILLHIGTNTLNTRSSSSISASDPNSAANQLARLLDFLGDEIERGALSPAVKILVAQIIPKIVGSSWGGREAVYQQTVNYNSAIEGVVRASSVSEQAYVVDMFTAAPWGLDSEGSPTPDLPNPLYFSDDGLHPNDAGYDIMAGVWFQGLRDAGLLPPASDGHGLAGFDDSFLGMQGGFDGLLGQPTHHLPEPGALSLLTACAVAMNAWRPRRG